MAPVQREPSTRPRRGSTAPRSPDSGGEHEPIDPAHGRYERPQFPLNAIDKERKRLLRRRLGRGATLACVGKSQHAKQAGWLVDEVSIVAASIP